MLLEEVLARLESLSNPEAVMGMARFGISTKNTYGVAMPQLREIGKNHLLAQQLWSSGIHEGRILACLIDDPVLVTSEQLESWVRDFDSWDVCDQCCGNLFDKTRFAYEKAVEWSSRREEFVKRAGFTLMASLAVHDKRAEDEKFEEFLPIIMRESQDGRNFAKKAANWALRQIGKRNLNLNRVAVETAKGIGEMDSRAARWIAFDALRELTSEKIRGRLRSKERRGPPQPLTVTGFLRIDGLQGPDKRFPWS